MRLQGKRILVTAAGQGIGRASALRFAGEGTQVQALYRASDESAFTTGAIHLIDGGWSN